MLLALLLAGLQQDAAAIVTRHREATSARVRCERPQEGGDIVVCGLREAETFRVPFRTIVPGDPKREGVPQERYRLIRQQNNCERMSLFLVGCGSVGVSSTVSARGVQLIEREPPP